MALPTKKAEIELRHVICYLNRTEHYGLLLPYTKYKSKKAEILGHEDEEGDYDLLESFTDSDWAGDKSSEKKRKHSVSSAMLFLNGCLVSGSSRSQQAISLSSCEAEFLAASGGAAESIQIKDPWEFLSKRTLKIRSITDNTS